MNNQALELAIHILKWLEFEYAGTATERLIRQYLDKISNLTSIDTKSFEEPAQPQPDLQNKPAEESPEDL